MARPTENLQGRVRATVGYINTHLIAEAPRNLYDPGKGLADALGNDGKICDISNFAPVSTTLLFLNSCLGNNTLFEGGSGTGKTRLASVVGSLLFQFPYEMLEMGRIVGIPGATVNEIYATHDIAQLNQGKDVAFMYLPFHARYLIIDEINRYSEIEQNRIREGLATGIWKYAGHSWKVRPQMVVSAINPESYGGTFFMNENLVDNFVLVIEPPYYNSIYHESLVTGAEENIKKALGLEEKVDGLRQFYAGHKDNPGEIAKELAKLQQETLKVFRDRGIPLVENGLVGKIGEEIRAIGFTPEANLFFHSVLAEMTYSKQYGRLRFDDPPTKASHDAPYLVALMKEGLAGRFLKDWKECSKAIAWYFGKNQVDVEDVRAGFIYTSPRRIKADEKFRQQVLNNPRQLPVLHAAATELVDKAWKNYSDLKGPAGKESQTFNQVRGAIRIITGDAKGDVAEAIKILKSTDHPLGRSVLEAVALHEFYQQQEKR